jgi:hypothetical protein
MSRSMGLLARVMLLRDGGLLRESKFVHMFPLTFVLGHSFSGICLGQRLSGFVFVITLYPSKADMAISGTECIYRSFNSG